MSNERLNSLALMYQHKDILPRTDEVIHIFSEKIEGWVSTESDEDKFISARVLLMVIKLAQQNQSLEQF